MRGESGRVVKRGRIRVDARKAITKLREHLLVDLHLYAVEVVRAAMLAGASRVDVTFDADDVIIAFDGRALDPGDLPRLFEHLTADAEGDDARFPRLLALAVNAALGLAPAWISVTTSSGGGAARVTWTPALVLAIERDERPLPEPEPIARPSDMPATGTRFQLRRKVGWEVVRRAAARTAPREIALLREVTIGAARAPLFIQGAPAAPPPRPRALARAPLSLPGVREAHLEIIDTIDVAPHADLCELGLLLARTSFSFGRHFPMAAHLGVSPPVRVVIDADALPTNASRSAVREDTPLTRALPGAAAAGLADAIAGVAAALFGRGSAPEGVTVDTTNRTALEDALGAFLCIAEASLVARVALPDALRSVLDMPLFRDGVGRPLSHAEIPRADPLLVWAEREPPPPEMEPWARAVVWRRGRLAERVLGARDAVDPEKLADIARRGAARYRRLLAAPAGEPSVPDDTYFCRERFSFAEGPLAGLAGEIAIAASPATYVRNMGLRVFLEGRCFETFPVPEDAVALPCLAALQWPGQITSSFGHDGVEMTAGLRGAIAFAVRAAVLLCEEVAVARAEGPWSDTEATLLRGALATAAIAPTRMYSLQGFEMPALAGLPGLVGARIWPTTAGRFTSLQALCDHASKTGAVCVVTPGTPGAPPDDRPVVSVPSHEIEHLRRCLHPKIQIVRYDTAMRSGLPDQRRRAREHMAAFVNLAAADARAPVLRIEAPGHTCFVTLGQSEARVWHGTAELSQATLEPSFGGVTIAVDDDSIVPQERWDGVMFALDPGLAGHAERAYADRVTAALLGDERARGELSVGVHELASKRYPWPASPHDLPVAVRRYLIDRAARGRAEGAAEADRAIAARIELIPFLSMIGADGTPAPASLAAVDAAHPAPRKVPCLRQPPRFRPVRWRPVIAREEALLAALVRWSDGRARDAADELPEQERIAGRELEYVKFLERPTVDVSVVGPRGDTASPTVVLPATPDIDLPGVAAALPAKGVEITHALVEVTFEGRVVCEKVLTQIPFPLVARVSIAKRELLDGFDRLSPYGESTVGERARHAAVPLVLAVLERASRAGAAHQLFGDLRALQLLLAVVAHEAKDERVVRALRDGPLLWPTVQGAGRPWGQLRCVDLEVWAGTVAYASWIAARPPSELDRPILHVPPSAEGSVIVGILEKLKVKIRPVSDAIATLQAQRAKGATDRLRLAERPAHPALAAPLETIGSAAIEGELGIYESGEAACEIHALDGQTKRIPLELPFPARAVARIELLTMATVARTVGRITHDAVTLLVGLAGKLDELPPFVRAHLRTYVCRAFSKDQDLGAAARAAPIFRDTDGAHWSLDHLNGGEKTDWSCTFDPPPYPEARQEGRTLVLTPAEHLQLHAKIKILNVTEWMRRDLEGERRRAAPQVEHVRFDAAASGHLLASFEVNEGTLTGEIGLLKPLSEGARGIQVFVTRRPVCRIDDAPGWPLAAVLNDDNLHPNRWFIELAPAEETRLRSHVRKMAGDHLRRTLLATLPPDRLAETFLESMVPPVAAYGSTEPMSVTGYLYLPGVWPVTPSLRIVVQGREEAIDHAIEQAAAPIHAVLPIGGALFVSHREAVFGKGAVWRLALALRVAAEKLLAPLLAKAPDDPELSAYRWNLRLLGATSLGSPTATSVDGREITADEILSALEIGEIWLTDRRGSIDGAFPVAAPPFVLADEPSPPVRVLRARLPRSKLRTLGGLEQAKAESTLAPPSIPPPHPADLTAPMPPESNRRPSRSWLGAVIDRVSGALGGGKPGDEPAPTGIGDAVERALRALRLRDEPVIVVKEIRRGKLLRYEKANRVITINVAHPALAPIAASRAPAAVRRACLALTAAALSEVNIALEHVTDHDESQALLELLRQDAAAAAQANEPPAAPRADPPA